MPEPSRGAGRQEGLWALSSLTVRSTGMSGAQAGAVIRLCGDAFNIDYAYLMDLCPVRTHVLGYFDGELRRPRAVARPAVHVELAVFTAAYVKASPHPDHRRLGYRQAVMRRLQDEIKGFGCEALSPAVGRGCAARLGALARVFLGQEPLAENARGDGEFVYRTPQTTCSTSPCRSPPSRVRSSYG